MKPEASLLPKLEDQMNQDLTFFWPTLTLLFRVEIFYTFRSAFSMLPNFPSSMSCARTQEPIYPDCLFSAFFSSSHFIKLKTLLLPASSSCISVGFIYLTVLSYAA
ncbi:hypothetical protein F2P56_021256 [Juglans regia]|uniref:Uncharacterized protein n=1 Tax=Juglans regia TaxID=51240 RepID=A0A833TD97_JUGRE|nr:hypothetical protein F2P56_021256 [Juglans regia]